MLTYLTLSFPAASVAMKWLLRLAFIGWTAFTSVLATFFLYETSLPVLILVASIQALLTATVVWAESLRVLIFLTCIAAFLTVGWKVLPVAMLALYFTARG